MERLVFSLEYQNAAGDEIEKVYTADNKGIYSIEDVRVVPFLKPGASAYGYSGATVGEYHVTVDVRTAPFTKYVLANDNRSPKICLKVTLLAVCSQIMKLIGSRASRKTAEAKDKYAWLRAPF